MKEQDAPLEDATKKVEKLVETTERGDLVTQDADNECRTVEEISGGSKNTERSPDSSESGDAGGDIEEIDDGGVLCL